MNRFVIRTPKSKAELTKAEEIQIPQTLQEQSSKKQKLQSDGQLSSDVGRDIHMSTRAIK